MKISSNRGKYISLKKAEEKFGYTPSHVSFLIRKGEIKGKKIISGSSWQVLAEDLREYRLKNNHLKGRDEAFESIKGYIPLKDAAKIFGYAPDYIGYLIRTKKITGKRVYSGVSWLVKEEEIKQYLKSKSKYHKLWGKVINLKLIQALGIDVKSIKRGTLFVQEKISYWTKAVRLFITASKYGALSTFLAIVIFGGLLVWAFSAKEETQTIAIYALNSEGEWQNTSNAKGKPDVSEQSDFDAFSETNSAVYKNGPMSLVISGFTETGATNEQRVDNNEPAAAEAPAGEATSSPSPPAEATEDKEATAGEAEKNELSPENSETGTSAPETIIPESVPEISPEAVPTEEIQPSPGPTPSEEAQPNPEPIATPEEQGEVSPIPTSTEEVQPEPSLVPEINQEPTGESDIPLSEKQSENAAPEPSSTETPISFWQKVKRFASGLIAKANETPTFDDLTKQEFVSAKIKLSLAIGEHQPDLIIPAQSIPSEEETKSPPSREATGGAAENNEQKTETASSTEEEILNEESGIMNQEPASAKATAGEQLPF